MSTEQISIVIVDDNPDNLRVLSTILHREGYKVRPVTSGEMALKAIHAQPPHLILLDIRMPQMSGYDVCTVLKTSPQTWDIPIIFISALDDAEDKVKAFELGGADYITKPFQFKEVLARTKHQLTIQQQRQQLIELYEQVQNLNMDLERQVQVRTLELQQALRFETLLKGIIEKVRDFFEQHLILQAVAEGLTQALQAQAVQVILSTSDSMDIAINYPSPQPNFPLHHQEIFALLNAPTFHNQLQQGMTIPFCSLTIPDNTMAVLVCPIRNERTILGSLWLYKPALSLFDEQEIELLKQVANHCAIGLRQAQLYQAAQTQVEELQRLNQLKDDFLSTISHELRTPVATIRIVLELLMSVVDEVKQLIATSPQAKTLEQKLADYFKILQDECEREISLIQNLLELQYLEAGTRPLELTTIHLHEWIHYLLEPFIPRIQSQQQHLNVMIAPDIPALTTDTSGLHSILTELLENACKYTPCGETISLEAFAQTGVIFLTVTNSGVEIPATEQPHIFNKFYRVHHGDQWQYSGTGLGLALVKKWVDYLNGSLELSCANNSTRFTVTLPITEAV